MATDFRTDSEPTVTRLVTGIVGDIQSLLKQQLALFQHEVTSDFRRTREAALSLVAGVVIAALGFTFVLFMVVHWLHWITDGRLPLWGCHGIVGGALLSLGGVLYLAGKVKFSSFNPLPDESAQAMKENIQCLTKQN